MKLVKLNNSPEIFYSIQGEGASTGTPAVFIRLFGCNLSCRWCDTNYTWNNATNQITIHEDELIKEIKSYPAKHLVITGGEPLIQQDALMTILEELKDYTIEIETNGSIMPRSDLLIRVDQWNVSPKLHHSGNTKEKAIHQDTLFALSLHPHAWFKFVVQDENDVLSALDLAAQCKINHSQIILMPQASTRDDLEQRRLKVIDWCLKYNLRFSDRLHITLWDRKLGV